MNQNLYLLGHRRAAQYIKPSLDVQAIANRPGDSQPFDNSSAPFVNYPAAGAAAGTVLTWQVPPGYIAVVRFMAIVHVGGGFDDGSGAVIWRVLRNGAALRGMNNLQSQFGSWALPNDVQFVFSENDTITITAEVPLAMAASAPPPTSTTGARMRGFFFPMGARQ